MQISKHINFRDIKKLTPPPPGLRRSWATPCMLETVSLAEHNKKQSVVELNRLFDHIKEIQYNKYVYKLYLYILSNITQKNLKYTGYHHKTMYKKRILDYIINVNNTRFNCYNGIPQYY